jgi:hypothetical protein
MQAGRKRYLIDIIIETICSCRDDPGENVQLQVLKALLTVVSSNTCHTHGESLLLAVRACYHIYLVSKNPVNRSTAKASLTQILSIVFQRMEAEQSRADGLAPLHEESAALTSPLAVPVLTSVECDPDTTAPDSPSHDDAPRSQPDALADSNPGSTATVNDSTHTVGSTPAAAAASTSASADASVSAAAGAGVPAAVSASPPAPALTPASM